jgi:NAD(P)-dependent dehydrogenase (short-subunit alcohol dehydrogenase family)
MSEEELPAAARWLPADTFAGEVAVVTGGGTGLGLEISRGLAALGATVVVASRDATHHGALLDEAKRRAWRVESLVLDDGLYFAGDAAKLFVAERRNAEGLSTNQTIEFQLEVRSGSVPLEVTCAFTDFAGTVNASNPVVNDLDLVVLSPGNAQTFLGNVFAGGWSATGGIADAKNNIERVAVLNPAVGTWTLRITGRNVPQNRQGFGLCANGDLAGCLDLAASVAYGAGKAGLRGVPLLGAGTLPRLPSMWQLSLSRALENAPAILLFSAMPASIAFDGATILVDPQVFLAVGTSPTGSVNLPFQLPDDAILCGISTYWQAWIPNDPGAAGMGWAASNGLAMRMGW